MVAMGGKDEEASTSCVAHTCRRVLWEELQGQYSCKHYVDKESPHVNDHDYNVEGSPDMSSLIYIYS